MIFKTACVCFVAFLFVTAGTAKPASRFSTQSLDLEAKRLPVNYQGHSLTSLMSAIYQRKVNSTKGEYENSEQHANRLKLLESQPLLGNVTMKSAFAFMLTMDSSTYDADSQTLNVVFEAYEDGPTIDELNEYASMSKHYAWLWDFSEVNQGAFIARNAFGVKWRASAVKQNQWYLFTPLRLAQPKYLFNIEKTSIALAKQYKRNLRMLYIGKPLEPYLFGSEDVANASLDNPQQLHSISYGMYFQPTEYWIYDYATGEILGKQKIATP